MPEYKEIGVTELIGINENIAQNEFAASVSIDVTQGTGEPDVGFFDQLAFFSSETGSGAVLAPAGDLLFLDADPAVAAGDAALSLAEWKTVFGKTSVLTTDWVTDANGGAAFLPIPTALIRFPRLSTIYLAFLLTSATPFNTTGGKDEILEINLWFRPDR